MADDLGEKNTIASCIFNEVEGTQQRVIDFGFEGLTPHESVIQSNGERSYCGFSYVNGPDLPPHYGELE